MHSLIFTPGSTSFNVLSLAAFVSHDLHSHIEIVSNSIIVYVRLQCVGQAPKHYILKRMVLYLIGPILHPSCTLHTNVKYLVFSLQVLSSAAWPVGHEIEEDNFIFLFKQLFTISNSCFLPDTLQIWRSCSTNITSWLKQGILNKLGITYDGTEGLLSGCIECQPKCVGTKTNP